MTAWRALDSLRKAKPAHPPTRPAPPPLPTHPTPIGFGYFGLVSTTPTHPPPPPPHHPGPHAHGVLAARLRQRHAGHGRIRPHHRAAGARRHLVHLGRHNHHRPGGERKQGAGPDVGCWVMGDGEGPCEGRCLSEECVEGFTWRRLTT